MASAQLDDLAMSAERDHCALCLEPSVLRVEILAALRTTDDWLPVSNLSQAGADDQCEGTDRSCR